MAQFNIVVHHGATGVTDVINAMGRKESDSYIAKYNGREEARNYDYYYIRKPNRYGIKWVILKKGYTLTTNVASNNLPTLARVIVRKIG